MYGCSIGSQIGMKVHHHPKWISVYANPTSEPSIPQKLDMHFKHTILLLLGEHFVVSSAAVVVGTLVL